MAARGVLRRLAEPFGLKGLTGIAFWGFCILSAIATGLGFADLRAANTNAETLSLPEMVVTGAITLFVVCAMVVALHQVLAPRRPWWIRILSLPVYAFFAIWTVGFGYGFFWKELAGQEFTEGQFERALTDVSGAAARAGQALETAETAAVDVAALAAARAKLEAETGRTCANRPNSTPGEGPLMRSRFAFAARTEDLATDVRARWIAPLSDRRAALDRRIAALSRGAVPADGVAADERALLERLARSSTLPPAERRDLFLGVHQEAKAFADASNGLRSLLAASYADRLAALAVDVGPDPQRPGSPDASRAADASYCWDVVLSDRLTDAAQRMREVTDIATPQFDFIEGPKATRAAFFGLMAWAGRTLGLAASQDDSFPFGEREFLALFASVAVDLGIVFLTLVRFAGDTEPKHIRTARGALQPSPPALSSLLNDAPARRAKRPRQT